MVQKYICTDQIEKLGHKIQEIRERALFNIISKLNNGVLFDNDLARSNELVTKLFRWFLFEPCTKEEVVFNLLKRIFMSESGKTLINHLGKHALQKEVLQIRCYLEPKYYSHLDELSKILEHSTIESVVPPLRSDVPLSYRTTTSSNNFVSPVVETTATPLEGFVYKGSSVDQETGADHLQYVDGVSSFSEPVGICTSKPVNESCRNSLPNFFFKWQPLIEPDRHVLQKVEDSLTNPTHPASVLHSCEFFSTVLLHDFPAEIFLQRPSIVLEFYKLLTCGSSRIVTAILNCLNELTKTLCIRISHTNELCMRNFKLQLLVSTNSFPNTPPGSDKTSTDGSHVDASEKFEHPEQVRAFQMQQLATPKYCFLTATAILKYICVKENAVKDGTVRVTPKSINLCLDLLEGLSRLFGLVINTEIWTQTQNETTLSILRDLNTLFVKYGEALEYFRLESLLSETRKCRLLYLYLTNHCAGLLQVLVPVNKTDLILPRNLRSALSNCLLDTTLGRLFPKLHAVILEYLQNCSDFDNLKKYDDIRKICQGMSATMKFVREHKILTISENLKLALDALPSLMFHLDPDFTKIFIDTISDQSSQVYEDSIKLARAEEVVLSLLAYSVCSVREEAYRLCHKKVLTTIGPNSVCSSGVKGLPILFLLTANILTEIAAFGATSENQEIQTYSEDILIYILKSKLIVCESIWDKMIQSLIPSLPIIACHANRNSSLGKTIINLADPDVARSSFIPSHLMLKTNAQFLFIEDSFLREEAFSRICWLLSSQENSRDLLPRVNMLYDTSLAKVCRLKSVIDVNKIRRTEHFYQPSSLNQVMDVLHSPNVEPVIRRSALNQISVMIEDPLLHQIFLDASGLNLVTNILKSALMEADYWDYPDSVIPIVSILKNLCFYHSAVRDELSNNKDVIFWILRGLFLYFTEERMKQDSSILLFLLIFKDFIRGSPLQANFSLPNVVCEKLMVPFQCEVHWNQSEHTIKNLKDTIISDRWCLSSLQIHWNAEVFGGFENLTKWDNIEYDDSAYHFEESLKLNSYDLKCIKSSSIYHCVRDFLNKIQSGTSHEIIIESVEYLISYIYLYKLSIKFDGVDDSFYAHPWEQSFARFIKALPSCEDDIMLLKSVFILFSVLAQLYSDCGKDCWISSVLKDRNFCLLDILSNDGTTNEEVKIISQELLKLIMICARQEQHYLDYFKPLEPDESVSWVKIIQIIGENLKFSDAQHFYNLAYLDSLLSTLVHLTVKLGWSTERDHSCQKTLIPDMVSGFCELLGAFHRGKGPSAALSVMGLSIIRHILLILNHLLAELQMLNVKGWHMYFFGEAEWEETILNFVDLWRSRDVIIRAAAVQLFTGFTVSPTICKEIMNEIKIDKAHLCELAFIVLIDHSEANIVRENAVGILSNFAGHATPLYAEKSFLSSTPVLNKSSTVDIFSFIEEYDFYGNLVIILNNLFTISMSDVRKLSSRSPYINGSEKSWSSDSEDKDNSQLATTPGLVKAVSSFLYNILCLDAENVSRKLQEMGLVKLIFRTLCNPSMSISNTTELMLYCDILEMNSVVCSVLTRLASCNTVCVGTILHTKDCLNLLLSLLNPRIYHIHLPQLLYLRNKLWKEIFNLMSTLLEYSGDLNGNLTSRSIEAVSVFSGTVLELGNGHFIETICESISSLGYNDLQNAALTVLTCLLRVETFRTIEKHIGDETYSSFSFQTLLDSVRTPRTVIISDTKENRPSKPVKQSTYRPHSEKNKFNLLEEVYFGKLLQLKTNVSSGMSDDIEVSFMENQDSALMSGAEICKVLLYLYDVCDLNIGKNTGFTRKKSLIVSALASLLGVSKEAKKYALEKGLLAVVVKQLKELHIRLSLESVDCFRRIADKKRVCPMLQNLNDLIGLLNNFMVNDKSVKEEAATLNVADIIHKLWVWVLLQNTHIVDVLKMICTYTTDCSLACQTLPLTSSVAGSGPRKSPSNISLLHALITLISKQMDQISKTHDLRILELSFNVLHNSCEVLECRVLISKSNLFQSISRLHPAITKRQKPWESIELLWLDFLQTFTTYPEGQTSVAKISDLLDLVMTMTNSSRVQNRQMALLVLRNLSFYQPNRLRLLGSGDFISILLSKLTNGTVEEKNTVVMIVWALTANNQKAKIVLKSAQIDVKLQNAIKQYELLTDESSKIDSESLNRMHCVLSILRDSEKK